MPHLPRNLMIALSPAQGMALLFLWRAAADGTWPRSLRRRNIAAAQHAHTLPETTFTA